MKSDLVAHKSLNTYPFYFTLHAIPSTLTESATVLARKRTKQITFQLSKKLPQNIFSIVAQLFEGATQVGDSSACSILESLDTLSCLMNPQP